MLSTIQEEEEKEEKKPSKKRKAGDAEESSDAKKVCVSTRLLAELNIVEVHLWIHERIYAF